MLVVLLNLWPGNKGSNAYASEFLAIMGGLRNEKREGESLIVTLYMKEASLK